MTTLQRIETLQEECELAQQEAFLARVQQRPDDLDVWTSLMEDFTEEAEVFAKSLAGYTEEESRDVPPAVLHVRAMLVMMKERLEDTLRVTQTWKQMGWLVPAPTATLPDPPAIRLEGLDRPGSHGRVRYIGEDGAWTESY